jgi:DNA-binding transcriptional LysR family regulator
MNLNLRHLQIFREVARTQSISAAARSVHVSQPAVTQAIGTLERHFAVALFVRSHSGVTLTPAGHICAQRTDRAIAQLTDAIAELPRSLRARSIADSVRVIRSTHLEALNSVVAHRNFSLAARALQKSQPTIHRAARELERVLGVPLFEKTSFGIVPTREAAKLARRARLALAELAQAHAEIQSLAGAAIGRTVIGAMPLARSFLVPRALIDFADEFPEHEVSIIEGTYEHMLSELRAGAADVLVGALRDRAQVGDVVQEHLFDDPLAIVVRAGHPLTQRTRVSVAALTKYPWVVPRSESPLRKHFNALFESAGVDVPRGQIECNSLVAARALLMESDRLLLLSSRQIHYELQAGMLVALPHPAGTVLREIGMTWRRDWHPTSAQQRLIELLRQYSRGTS